MLNMYDDYVLHISKERDVLWNRMTDIKANHIHTRTLWFSYDIQNGYSKRVVQGISHSYTDVVQYVDV